MRKVGDAFWRQRQDAVDQPDLVEHLECRRMHRVAAEVAVEVRVRLEQAHLDALAGEQQAQDHAGRSAPDNAAIYVGTLVGVVMAAILTLDGAPGMSRTTSSDYPE